MFFSNLFQRKRPRAFRFTPYYYEAVEDVDEEPQQSRIHFRRIRQRTLNNKNSVRIKILFAIVLVFFLYYFQGLLEADKKDFKIEEIRINELPTVD